MNYENHRTPQYNMFSNPTAVDGTIYVPSGGDTELFTTVQNSSDEELLLAIAKWNRRVSE